MSSETAVDTKAPAAEAEQVEATEVAVAAKQAEAVAAEVAVDAVYLCLDVSGSIRISMYPEWVTNDIQSLAKTELPADARWVLWGTGGETRDNLEQVVEYLAGHDCMGGNEPVAFIEKLPRTGVVDLHVYTDGMIDEYSITDARAMLAGSHRDLKIRRVVVTYVNTDLGAMNVGLSAVFDGHVLQMHSTRIADGTRLMQFDAAPLDSSVGVADILDEYFVLGKSEEEMTKGLHYLSQKFANASPARRRDIRRLVKERADAVNAEHRARTLTAEEEKALLEAVERRDWATARKPFVGNVVKDEVKLLQGHVQRFLNQTREGGLIRISAYAPLVLESKGGQQFDMMEEVLLDHIMFLGMGKDAVVVMPVVIAVPEPRDQKPEGPAAAVRGGAPRQQLKQIRGKGRAARIARLAVRARLLNTATKCALAATIQANFDNTFGLDTLFSLREQQMEFAGWNNDDTAEGHDGDAAQDGDGGFQEDAFVEQLQAGAHLQSAEQDVAAGEQAANALYSSSEGFGKNPFTRQRMECVLLVPASAESLTAERLAQVDAWNAHMLSRFVRGGRSMPSVPLVLALLLEKAFSQWKLEDIPRAEDRAEGERLRDVWRGYVARMPSPLTFTVGMPVVVTGSFAAAAHMACAVLQAALDPRLPLDVLTQFWSTQSEADAHQVWDTLRVYAGLGDAAPFPADLHRTLCALVAGVQYAKSGRDARLRAKKGVSYSVRAYTKRLDALAQAGCHPDRLALEEKMVRKDLTGAAMEQPLLCAHGVEADKCEPLEGQQHDTLCVETCRPTLLNRATLDMWYVGLPADPEALALDSLHKAMWQLARKRTKGKRPRFQFPPPETEFAAYVNHRVRAAFIQRDGDAARVLPTVPCARLVQDIALTYFSYAELVNRKPSLNRQKFMKALRAPRAVCEFGDCCEYIREAAATEEQRAWIDAHATHAMVAGDQDVLSGKLSYRNL